MQLIEWAFTILSFVSFYFFIGKRASKANFRLIGFLLSIIISILLSIFSFSIGVLSIGIIQLCYIFLSSYGMINCILEIRKNKKFVKDKEL
ncbi:MAG: hypothetical protein GF383_09420 [Candidatus Lokiarchaeota archaeon]|nr:hypothetical protein [Candidatus Lokiarchaeota archaeon]